MQARFRWRCLAVAMCVFVGPLVLSPSRVVAEDQAAVPRYRLSVGQELQFTGTKRSWMGAGDKEPKDTPLAWRIWVVVANADGGWDLIVEEDAEGGRKDDSKTLFRVTLYPDGRMPWNSTLAALPAWLSLRRVLPCLPSDEEWARSQWTCVEPRTAIRWDYTVGSRSAAPLAISATCRGPLEIVSVGQLDFNWEFDTARGMVTGYTAKGAWEDYKDREEESLALTGTIEHDTAEIKKLREDVDRYFALVAGYDAKFTPRDRAKRVRAAAAIGVDAQQQQMRDWWAAAEKQCTSEIAQQQIRQLLARHDRFAESAKASQEDFVKIVDHDSPDWAAEDLDGKTHKLADYRGKVVVLDFWFRKCNYCIRAQPQFDAIIERFKGQPVAFLGVNIDKDIKDARFAVAKLDTPYPTLFSEDVQKQYGLHSSPTWLVLDQQGVVRGLHVGYSATLQEELGETIAGLLEKPR